MNEFLVWLKLWFPFISLLSALFVAVAAGAAWRSASITKKAIRGQITLEILSEYASQEMLENLRILRIWKNGLEQKEDISKEELAKARRSITHFFFKIYKLVDTDVVKKSFVRKLISNDQIYLYINVVEGLEAELNPDYNQVPFDFFRELHTRR